MVISKTVECHSCKGTGKWQVHVKARGEDGWRIVPCARCNGTGKETIVAEQLPLFETEPPHYE